MISPLCCSQGSSVCGSAARLVRILLCLHSHPRQVHRLEGLPHEAVGGLQDASRGLPHQGLARSPLGPRLISFLPLPFYLGFALLLCLSVSAAPGFQRMDSGCRPPSQPPISLLLVQTPGQPLSHVVWSAVCSSRCLPLLRAFSGAFIQ